MKSRPPPYNPGHSSVGSRYHREACSPTSPNAPQYEGHADENLTVPYGSSGFVEPPPPPRRVSSSLPRRVRPVVSDSPPPPPYEESVQSSTTSARASTGNVRPIGFEAIASATRRQPRARAPLPMSPTSQQVFYQPTINIISPNVNSVHEESCGDSNRNLCDGCRCTIGSSSQALQVTQAISPPVAQPRRFSASNIRSSCTRLQNPRVNSDVNRVSSSSAASNIPTGKLDSALTLESEIDHSEESFQNARSVHAMKDLVLVVDSQSMVVRVYRVQNASVESRTRRPSNQAASPSHQGYSRLNSFKVVGVKNGCIFADDKLALCTHRGIRITSLDGNLIHEISIGNVVCVKPHARGIMAIQPQCLRFYNGPEFTQTQTLSRLHRQKLFMKRNKNFIEISDVVSASRNRLIIVDAGAGVIYISSSVGKIEAKIDPAALICGPLSRSPCCVSVDKYDNIFVSDTGNRRILQFLANGTFMTTLLQFTAPRSVSLRSISAAPLDNGGSVTTVHGVAMTGDGKLVTIVGHEQCFQVRLYRFL